MNEDYFNMQIRKFLKNVGVTSQREIETAVRDAVDAGKLGDGDAVAVTVALTIPSLGVDHKIEGLLGLGEAAADQPSDGE